MSLVWLCRLKGQRRVERVYGPDLMLALCARSQACGYRHFLYGLPPVCWTRWRRAEASSRVHRGGRCPNWLHAWAWFWRILRWFRDL
jgi:UDP-N-acetyl-D-mannosaminuronic acid transferase (WecB/TagA/CpsF family)